MALISIVAPCFNEESNIPELYQRLCAVFTEQAKHHFEIIFIDNCSEDRTVDVIKAIAATDKRVKLIVNARNFGHIRSPFYGLLQAYGDAVITLATDLQDPPELISNFIAEWEAGFLIVAGVNTSSEEHWPMAAIRRSYYRLLSKISEGEVIQHFTGFGLYDQKVVALLRDWAEPYPYFRGMISDLGFKVARVPFFKPVRKHGLSSNNFYTLYDMAMLGITNHSRLPLRLAIFAGAGLGVVGVVAAVFYLLFKLLFWNAFEAGQAPTLIALLLFSSVQLFFIGLIGEYILTINVRGQKRPLVVESERVNFDAPSDRT